MFELEFMRIALIALLLITPLLGLLGTVVVESKLAFFSDALGHSALTGVAIGSIFGIARPGVAMTLFALVFALVLDRIRRSQVASSDTVISVFSSTAIALGLVLLSGGGGFNKFSTYLIGDILTISRGDLWYLSALLAPVLLYWFFCFNKLALISVSPLLAASKGVRVNLHQTIFLLVLTVVVMSSIRWVGVLMINSLLILPPAAARNISRNLRTYQLLSVVFALVAGVAGLGLSYAINTATGPTIALIGAAMFFVTYALRGKAKA
ncbi:zinc ABC transporter permease [Clostridia bacterium]|nr:zinc ABC transporter permease [Clostridia bacterium]